MFKSYKIFLENCYIPHEDRIDQHFPSFFGHGQVQDLKIFRDSQGKKIHLKNKFYFLIKIMLFAIWKSTNITSALFLVTNLCNNNCVKGNIFMFWQLFPRPSWTFLRPGARFQPTSISFPHLHNINSFKIWQRNYCDFEFR